MSLLMDALRKAEDAKRQAGEAGDNATVQTASTPELTLAPLNPPRAASPLPELAEHTASLDADLSALTGEAPRQHRSAAAAPASPDVHRHESAERSAARNVFSAKTSSRPRRGPWLAIAAASALTALGLGAYFWWQLQTVGGGLRPLPAPAARVAPAPPTPQLAPQPPPDSPPPPTAAPVARPPAPLASGSTSAPPVMRPPRATPAPSERLDAPARRTRPVPSAAAPDTALQLNRSQPKAGQAIDLAYAALQAGRLDEAQRDYEQVLRNDAKSTDALLGLATIAARQGQLERAQGLYQRALETDPNDATAQAGLINSRGQGDPGLAESRLKSAVDAQPESAALHFALGNLYSRQARWSEAQQAYFRAYAAEPDNADILFNLAVSLDHLHQNKLAAQYYAMAIGAARDHARPVLFDLQQARNRARELQP